MTHYNSAKECLLKHGKIKEITRGRISADNHQFLAERIKEGDTIGGYESKVSTKPTGEKAYSNVKAPISTEKIIADIGMPTRDERAVEAFVYRDGKKVDVGIREVCSNEWCMSSLTYCKCPQPVYRVDVSEVSPVYFKERTKPLKTGW